MLFLYRVDGKFSANIVVKQKLLNACEILEKRKSLLINVEHCIGC